MSKQPRQKLKLLLLRQYLEENTDEEHPVSTAALIEFLAQNGVGAERKSIYDDMETLRLFGLDVNCQRRGPGAGWYLCQRDFQLPELRLLVDSVQSSRFITRKKSMELIRKIEKLASVHQAQELRRQVWVKNRIKSMNESIYYLVDRLHDAINDDKRVLCHYFRFDEKKQRQLRRGGERYELSPWALLWDDENYYLVAYDHDAEDIRHFRVDKLSDLRISDAPRLGAERFAALDMAAYANVHFGMFSGEPVSVRLRFHNSMAGAVIDRFGTEVMLLPETEERFTLTVPVAVTAPFFAWLCTFGDKAELLGPPEARAAMREHVARVAAQYEKGEESKA